MQKTQNYQLNQWESTDPIRRADFNADNAAIDAALAANAAAAEDKGYVVGSYTGDGGTQDIVLGFQPSFLIITGDESDSNSNYRQIELGGYFATSGPVSKCGNLTITETGFRVKNAASNFPHLNEADRSYPYLAFR